MDQIPDDPSIIEPTLEVLKASFLKQKTKPLNYRINQLKSLEKALNEMKNDLIHALSKDLGIHEGPAYVYHLYPCFIEIKEALKNIKCWAKPQVVSTPLILMPSKSYIYPEPLGVSLIMGSWNYPYAVVLMPLITAIAAGNCAIIKPSEMAPLTSISMTKMIEKYLDPDCYRSIQGQIEVAKAITKASFDLIVFTGSPEKGKLVAKAAAEKLVPCILELGGKCPVIVTKDAKIDLAVKRIISFKYANSGQTCVAPDYVFVHEDIIDSFLKKSYNYAHGIYGDDSSHSKDYGRMINEWHVNRLIDYIQEDHKGTYVFKFGEPNVEKKFFPVTMIRNPDTKCKMMTDEIFGPILPVYSYKHISEVIKFINDKDKPLALYYFGNGDSNECKLVNQSCIAGAMMVNDCGVHFTHQYIPFGGVGTSGQLSVRGYHGFKNMSHMKPVISRPNSFFLDIDIRYPPFTSGKLRQFDKLKTFLTTKQENMIASIIIFILILIIIAIVITVLVVYT